MAWVFTPLTLNKKLEMIMLGDDRLIESRQAEN